MKIYTPNDKNTIQQKIHIYKERRNKLRQKYGVSERRKAPDEYMRKISNINRKIRSWNQLLGTIDERKIAAIAIANHICYFMGVNVKNIGGKKDFNSMIAKGLYSKYGMENGICGKVLSEYMNLSSKTAPRLRMGFTRMLSVREYKEKWLSFKNYMKELENHQ